MTSLMMSMEAATAEMSLLLVDDDRPFVTRLARAMEARGYSVRTCLLYTSDAADE